MKTPPLHFRVTAWRVLGFAACLLAATLSSAVNAQGTRLWATGGITNVNGAAGGGITTWAVLNGYASDTETTANLSVAHTGVDDFGLNTASVGANWANRLAVTVSRNKLDVQPLHTSIEQETVGLKLRLAGEALYDRFGQYSIGAQYSHNADFGIPSLLGARDDSGLDFYFAASKVFLAGLFNRNVIVNATARATRANQLGLLGYGGDRNDGYDVVGEFGAGVFLNRQWLVGAEYRQKPNNLSAVDEDDWKSLFVVYAPSRYLALTLAYVDLGDIAGFKDQTGYFLSLQTGF